MALSKETALEELRRESDALARASEGRMAVRIPSCPGRHMVDLLVHTGAVQRAQSALVRTRASPTDGNPKKHVRLGSGSVRMA